MFGADETRLGEIEVSEFRSIGVLVGSLVADLRNGVAGAIDCPPKCPARTGPERRFDALIGASMTETAPARRQAPEVLRVKLERGAHYSAASR